MFGTSGGPVYKPKPNKLVAHDPRTAPIAVKGLSIKASGNTAMAAAISKAAARSFSSKKKGKGK